MENDLQDSIKSVFISDYPESPRPAVHRSPPDHRRNQLIRGFWKNNTFLSVKSWSCFNVFGWVVSMKGRTFHWCARNYSAEGQDFRKTFLAFICICLLLQWILLERNLSWEPISFYLYFQHNLNSEINDTLCFHQKFFNFKTDWWILVCLDSKFKRHSIGKELWGSKLLLGSIQNQCVVNITYSLMKLLVIE